MEVVAVPQAWCWAQTLALALQVAPVALMQVWVPQREQGYLECSGRSKGYLVLHRP